jgi:hypothetical protein
MNQFGITTRRWLLSVIRQRKLLLDIGKSRLRNYDQCIRSIDRLELYLGTFSYSDPVNMARFIRMNKGHIMILLPGIGSSLHEKRKKEFEEICIEAETIMQGHQKEICYGYSN